MYRAVHLQWAQDHEMRWVLNLCFGVGGRCCRLWCDSQNLQQINIHSAQEKALKNLDPFNYTGFTFNFNYASTKSWYFDRRKNWQMLRPRTWWSIVGNSHFLATTHRLPIWRDHRLVLGGWAPRTCVKWLITMGCGTPSTWPFLCF